MSLPELLVLLHLGSTAMLLLVLGLVMAVQRVGALSAWRLPATRSPALACEQQVIGLNLRAAKRPVPLTPGVAGGARRSS